MMQIDRLLATIFAELFAEMCQRQSVTGTARRGAVGRAGSRAPT